MYKYISIILFFCILSCTKSPKPIEPTIYLDYSNKTGVFIGNEGNFMFGNASLSFYDNHSKKVDNQIFFNTNNFPIGDVLQSIKIRNNAMYLVVNNSGKIYVNDKNNISYISTIKGLVSPRHIEFIDDQKAYITDIYSPSVAVFNLKTNQISSGIMIGISNNRVKSTEEMVRYKNNIFTCNWSFGDKVYKIDTQTDKLIDSLTVTKQPNSIVIDKNNKIWVLSDGSYVGSPIGKVTATITKIDAESFSVEQVLTFNDDKISPSRLRIDGNKENLYFIYGNVVIGNMDSEINYGIYKMSVESNQIPTTPFISAEKRLIFGLGIDPINGDIYFSDAIDYVQKGIVYRYNQNGEKVDSFKTGIIPSSFEFKTE